MSARAGRIAKRLVLVLLVGFGTAQVILTIGDWHLRDMGAYWEAGERLMAGEPLYPPLDDPEASETYRYAPWFAWLWAPLTLLPRHVVGIGWSAVLLAASAVALAPAIRARAWMVVILFVPILFGISAIGNVHPLLIAALVHGLDRRSGPAWIGAAASLKAVPILFALVYLGRGQLLRTAAAGLVAAVLVAPAALYDLSHYPAGAGLASGLIAFPPAYVIGVGLAMVVTIRLAPSDLGRLAAGTTATLAAPRLFVYDISYVLAALGPRQDADSQRTAALGESRSVEDTAPGRDFAGPSG